MLKPNISWKGGNRECQWWQRNEYGTCTEIEAEARRRACAKGRGLGKARSCYRVDTTLHECVSWNLNSDQARQL